MAARRISRRSRLRQTWLVPAATPNKGRDCGLDKDWLTQNPRHRFVETQEREHLLDEVWLTQNLRHRFVETQKRQQKEPSE
jgi:hypothetical protein